MKEKKVDREEREKGVIAHGCPVVLLPLQIRC